MIFDCSELSRALEVPTLYTIMPLTHFIHAYFIISSGEKKIPTFNQYISSNSHLSGKGNGKNLLTNMQQQ